MGGQLQKRGGWPGQGWGKERFSESGNVFHVEIADSFLYLHQNLSMDV